MKELSTKQLTLLIFVLAGSVKTFLLPSLLLNFSGRDSYLVMAIWGAIDILFLTIFLSVVKRYPNLSFYEMFSNVIGKFLTKIIFSVFILFFSFKICLGINETMLFFEASLYDSLVKWLFAGSLIISLIVMISKSCRGLGRIAEIFTPIILVSMIVLLFFVIPGFDIENLLPFLGNGAGVLGKSMTRHAIWFGDFTPLFVFMGRVKTSKHMRMLGIISAGVATILSIIFACSVFATYGNLPELLKYGFNISNISEINVGSFNNGRMDIIVYLVWLIAIFISLGVYLFAITSLSQDVIEAKKPRNIIIATGVILFLLSLLIFNNEGIMRELATTKLNIVAIVLQVGIPILTLIFALFPQNRRLYEQK